MCKPIVLVRRGIMYSPPQLVYIRFFSPRYVIGWVKLFSNIKKRYSNNDNLSESKLT